VSGATGGSPMGGPPAGGSPPRPSARIRRLRAEIVADGAATEGRYAVVEHHVPERTVTMPRHAFSREIATYYALAGTVTVVRDDDVVRLAPGDSLVVPAGVSHAVLVREGEGSGRDRDEPARFLAVFAPAGVETYYAEVAAAISPAGVPDLPAVLATSARYGIAVDMASLYDLVERFGVHLV
jgi:mannose-6-phosphate isomerase-like protein (cupin superfamily)